MSTFWVYFILQMDTVCSVIGWATLLSAGLLVFNAVALLVSLDFIKQEKNSTYKDEDFYASLKSTHKISKKTFKFSIPLVFIMLLLLTFTPSTKTLATAYVLPQIATAENVETLKKDLGELYTLAIGKTKDLLDTKETKPDEQKSDVQKSDVQKSDVQKSDVQ